MLTNVKENKIINFYGIKFYNFEYQYIIKKLLKKKSYLVAPAAYPLSEIRDNSKYFLSLKESTVAILDSGFFCILLYIFCKIKTKKFSGYLFFTKFINDISFKNKKILLINPDISKNKLYNNFFLKNGFSQISSYIAPIYNNNNNIEDKKILKVVNRIKPKVIVVNISGIKQEILANYIHKKINYNFFTICTGAAISLCMFKNFNFFDKLFLGWFYRLFIHRYIFKRLFKSFKIIFLFFSKKNIY
jgi:UDP-N-acetyl-D-mannosaminuronic acid transferase (WecB/TagA/CpsF family)